MSQEEDPTSDRHQIAAETSAVGKWALVLIVGELSLVLLIVVLGSVVKIDIQQAAVGALAGAILIGGRVGGVRGPVEWLVATVLIVTMAIVSFYLIVEFVGSKMTGP